MKPRLLSLWVYWVLIDYLKVFFISCILYSKDKGEILPCIQVSCPVKVR